MVRGISLIKSDGQNHIRSCGDDEKAQNGDVGEDNARNVDFMA